MLMNDYILLMHNDGRDTDPDRWDAYFAELNKTGAFQGGSSIGDGVCVSRSGSTTQITAHLTGYIRIRAGSLDEAMAMVAGNPVYETGGTVEIRELPRS